MRDQSMPLNATSLCIASMFFFLSLSIFRVSLCDAHTIIDLIKKHRMWHHVIININDYFI